MKILFLGTLLTAARITTASYCNKELQYHEQYDEYGSDIKCEHLTNGDINLMHLASYKPIYLQIKDSNITELKPKLFQSVKTVKTFEIVNSTFLFQDTPHPFKDFKLLEQLHIQNSIISEISDKTFETLEFLNELQLSNVNLKKLPKNSLSSLKNLRVLDLSGNKFSTTKNIPLCEVPHVKKIVLKMNELETIDTSTFVCKIVDNILDFDVNASKYEVSMLKPVFYDSGNLKTNLIYIDLSYNKLQSLNSALASLKSLKYMDLQSNKLSELSEHEFKELENLVILKLGNNLLSSISEAVFARTLKIRQIVLENNRLVNVNLSHLPVLQTVKLATNNFNVSCLEFWNELPKLQYLDLTSNNIEEMPPEVFKNLESISHLNISKNAIKLRKDSFMYLPNLTDLNLRYNNLTTLPPDIFANLTQLRSLDLSHNLLQEINPNTNLKEQHNLRYLNLSYNKLKYVDRQLFKPLRNLNVLDIDGNELRKIDLAIFSDLPYLRTFNIRNNKFSCEFLTDLIKFMKQKQIVYSLEKEGNITSENVEGIPCTESKKILIIRQPIEPTKNVSAPSGYKTSQKQERTSAATIFGVAFSVLAILSLLLFVLYKYYKRKKFIVDHFELIGD